MASYQAPGRLGNPDLSLATDPRFHPKLLALFKAYGLEKNLPVSAVTQNDSLDAIRAVISLMEDGLEQVYASVNSENPVKFPFTNITKSDELIPGPDGTELRLTIRKPADAGEGPLPCFIYYHGGGMVIGSTDNPPRNTFGEALAGTGLVVVTVHFRNAFTKAGDNPFPAGLNDCVAAARWVHEHRETLGISKIAVGGESGGGNLGLATALKANREGWIKEIDGVVGLIPFISGAWGWPEEWKARELPSLVENDGYTLDMATCGMFSRMYDPDGEHAKNPLAFPYWAGEDDLRGLPPHLIVTAELDPFRDEGNAYFRKLARADVKAVGRVTLGMVHGVELLFKQIVPELFEDLIWEMKKFIDAL